MGCDDCGYDCSNLYYDNTRNVPSICPYADVSGLGVLIGYTVNAGFVVIVIILNYVITFEPDQDPFQRWNGSECSDRPRSGFKPNPFDVVVLGALRRGCKSGAASWFRNKRLQRTMMKCVLSMSDLQILTGLSILISGFSQLRCGISIYQWKILVYLAWFSSMTHLGCLTFLRNYLYNHPRERTGRLLAMFIIIAMLSAAFIPTGYFTEGRFFNNAQVYISINPNSPALCWLRTGTPPEWASPSHSHASFSSMTLSIIFLVLGFCNRVIKLYQPASNFFVGTCRRRLSNLCRRLLGRLRARFFACEVLEHMRVMFAYRPALAMFLFVRVSCDMYTSMIGEVWWLVVSYGWGLVQLIRARSSPQGGDDKWTFGQVLPVVLTLTPILMMNDYFSPTHHDGSTDSASIAYPSPSINRPQESPVLSRSSFELPFAPDDPDNDFYQESWFKYFAVLPTAFIMVFSAFALYLAIVGSNILHGLQYRSLTVPWWTFFHVEFFSVSYIVIALSFKHDWWISSRRIFRKTVDGVKFCLLFPTIPLAALYWPIVELITFTAGWYFVYFFYPLVYLGLTVFSMRKSSASQT